jgi:hypothetical protein
MPRSQDHNYLCVFHADRERRILDQQGLEQSIRRKGFGFAWEYCPLPLD